MISFHLVKLAYKAKKKDIMKKRKKYTVLTNDIQARRMFLRRLQMDKKRNKVKDKALTLMNKVKANLKGTYYQIADIPNASVNELAQYIENHPHTKLEQKTLLGITYKFYRLKTDESSFYLETNDFRILQLDGYLNGKQIVSYRSYRDSYTLDTPIKLEASPSQP